MGVRSIGCPQMHRSLSNAWSSFSLEPVTTPRSAWQSGTPISPTRNPISLIRGDTLVRPQAGRPPDIHDEGAVRSMGGVNGIIAEKRGPEWLRSMNQRYFGIGSFRSEPFCRALNRMRVLEDGGPCWS